MLLLSHHTSHWWAIAHPTKNKSFFEKKAYHHSSLLTPHSSLTSKGDF